MDERTTARGADSRKPQAPRGELGRPDSGQDARLGQMARVLKDADGGTRASVADALQGQMGNAAVRTVVRHPARIQRDPPPDTLARDDPQYTHTVTIPVPQDHPLYSAYDSDNFSAAVESVAGRWTRVGGVIDRQKDAVRNFGGSGGAGGGTAPQIADQVMSTVMSVVLESALGKIGDLVKSGMESREWAESITRVVNAGVSEAKSKVKKAVADAISDAPPLGNSLADFVARQLRALSDLGEHEYNATKRALLSEPPRRRWEVARDLYDQIDAKARAAEQVQWNECTDAWFTQQTRASYGRNEAGHLNIFLADAYPVGSNSRLRASDATLAGAGSNRGIWSALQNRPLGDIGIPKVIRMSSGSMGRGWLDCSFDIRVHGGRRIQGPAVVSPGTALQTFSGGTQRPQNMRNNRWGDDWLAAKALGLRDIDGDDPRVNDQNVARGANMVWEELKDRTVQGLGATIDAPSGW